jgi:hypothetical protein
MEDGGRTSRRSGWEQKMIGKRSGSAIPCLAGALLLTHTGCDLDLEDFRLLQIQEFTDGPWLRIEDVNGETQIEFFGIEIVRDRDDE